MTLKVKVDEATAPCPRCGGAMWFDRWEVAEVCVNCGVRRYPPDPRFRHPTQAERNLIRKAHAAGMTITELGIILPWSRVTLSKIVREVKT